MTPVLFNKLFLSNTYKVLTLVFSFLVLVFGLCFSPITQAEDEHGFRVVELNEFSGHLELGSSLRYISDLNSGYDVYDLVKKLPELNWEGEDEEPNLGLAVPPHWFTLALRNNTGRDIQGILDISYTMIDFLDIYFVRNGKVSLVAEVGDQRPFSARKLANRNFLVPIEIGDGELLQVIVYGSSFGALKLPMDLWSQKAFFAHDQKTFAPQLIFFGLMLALVVYNSFLFLATRDTNYLLYVLCMVSISFVVMSFHGILAQFVWPETPSLNNTVLVGAISTNIAAGCAFIYSFLNLGRFHLLIRATFILHGLAGVVCFFLNFVFPYSVTIKLVALFSVTGASAGLIVSSYLWYGGEILARFYTLAWFSLLVGSVTITFSHMGWIPSWFIFNYGQQIGAGAEGLLLSFALAYRINMERRERFLAQAQLLELQKATNLELEHKNEQIHSVLKATGEMAKSSTKQTASAIALDYLDKLDGKIELSESNLYLPEKSGDGFTMYPLWFQDHLLDKHISRTTPKDKCEFLKIIKELTIVGGTLILPIKSESQIHAYLEINQYKLESENDEVAREILEGIAQSLVLKLDNLDAEEDRRLSGIGAMAASIAHDLKNPISAIIGYSDLARDESLTTAQRDEYLNIINEEALRLSSMAHEVLEFSRGDIQLQVAQIAVGSYVDDLKRILAGIFGEARIELVVDVEAEGNIELDCDRIRRVILNLATNARDAMVGSETESPSFHLSVLKEKNAFTILAKDNGPGIPEHLKATLFEPFTTHGKSNGTGLGMAIVKKMISAHGGTIEFESEIAEGTEFRITIPQPLVTTVDSLPVNNSEKEISQPRVVHDRYGEPNGMVLVADDNPVNLKLIQSYLNKLGYESVLAKSGDEAIVKMREQSIDLVLMDIEMPGMNGIETSQKIRSLDGAFPNVGVPIIALSGHDDDDHRTACVNAGMNGYLSKPLKIDMLRQAMDQHLRMN